MRTAPLSLTLAFTALSLIGFGQVARADDEATCTKAPKEQWQTIDQLKAKLVEQGYKVKEIEFEDGCAEADVEGKDGEKAELKLDPVTGAVVKSED